MTSERRYLSFRGSLVSAARQGSVVWHPLNIHGRVHPFNDSLRNTRVRHKMHLSSRHLMGTSFRTMLCNAGVTNSL